MLELKNEIRFNVKVMACESCESCKLNLIVPFSYGCCLVNGVFTFDIFVFFPPVN